MSIKCAPETDEQILNRLTDRFDTLSIITEATAKGFNRALIAFGAAGVGKSHGVETILGGLPNHLSYEAVSGNLKATGLYKLLYRNRAKGSTVLIDDSDSVFSDEVALNILKAATDTKEVRKISWGTETKFVDTDGEDIPNSFNFEGQIIILTNVNLADLAESGIKNSEHIKALLTRSQYIDLGFSSKRSLFLRVRQVVKAGMLSDRGIGYTEEEDILFFMESNLDNLREISIRTAIKLADLIRISQVGWKKLAASTILK